MKQAVPTVQTCTVVFDEAMIAGVVVSVAAGNDGPDNDGLSGMGSSDLSVTVGATDDKNTCLLYTSPSPRDATLYRMPSSA